MGNLIGKLSRMVMYICVATIISQVVGLVMLSSNNRLNSQTFDQLLAVVHGVELVPAAMVEDMTNNSGLEQASLSQLEEGEMIQQRQIELREQALNEGIVTLRNIRIGLEIEQRQFRKIKEAYEFQLNKSKTKAELEGIQKVQQFLESMKPKQAKGQLMKMIEDGDIKTVVRVIETMDDAKRKKLLATFTTDEEDEQKLYDILKNIQSQESKLNAINKAKSGLNQ